MTLRCGRPELASYLEPLEQTGLVFVADAGTGDDWEAVLAELREAFVLAKAAANGSQPMVFVVLGDDLLGRNGPGRAMVATGLLSGARTAATELLKAGVAVNVLAVEEDSSPETVAEWCAILLERSGPTGELVRLGGQHLGKALP